MDENHQKEQFSLAYVRAVAAVAGFGTGHPAPDDDSVDLTLYATATGRTERRPRLDLQVKCTSQGVRVPEEVRFGLKVKNYNDLRPPATAFLVPRILVVVVVPEAAADWLVQTEDELAMRHCGYWLSLHGSPETDNQESVTVTIPRQQVFSPEGLQGIMQRVNDGGAP